MREVGSPAESLRRLLERGPVAMPGVFNAISAKIAQQSGFQAFYLSGGGVATSLLAGPDIGLTTLSEVEFITRTITRVVPLPLVVDVDTGFGGASNVRRAVQVLERAGAAGVQIEDQSFPKRCGHLSGKELIATNAMEEKIQAAVDARRDPDFLIVARTDAKALEGISGAVERALRYKESGADVIFPEALESAKEFKQFSRSVPGWLMANMTEFGKTPYLTVKEFGTLGYRLVIFPMTALRAALKTMEEAYRDLKKSGGQKKILKRMMTRKELYKLLEYEVKL